MIDLTQNELFLLLVKSFCVGAMLGVVYDLVRFVKMLCGVRYDRAQIAKDIELPRRIVIALVTFISDFLFWVFFGIVSVILNYHVVRGIFRGMTYIGLFSGFALYNLTLGRFMVRVNSYIASKIKKIIKTVLKLIFKPLKAVFFAIISFYHLTIGRFIVKIIGVIKERIRKKKKGRIFAEEVSSAFLNDGRKEEYVYVDGEIGYRKQGRISFGRTNSR